jgi:hypothetical protein
MKVKELISLLQKCDPDAETICGTNNGVVDTYAVIDHIFENTYGNSIYNDLFGTPSPIDERLLSKEFSDLNKKIVYIGSLFPYKYCFNEK